MEDLLEKINKISQTAKYYFVRTTDGEYFDAYYDGGFISIGWNEISLDSIRSKTHLEVKKQIAELEGIDLTQSRSKGKATGIFNKINDFDKLNEGDYIVIPSRNSSRFAFGIIQDFKAYEELTNLGTCPHKKRRSVKWFSIRNSKELDPYFFQIKQSRHALSSIDSYSKFVDRELSNVYIKNDRVHFVMDVKIAGDINTVALLEFINSFQQSLEMINKTYEFNENTRESAIKLNIQSEGTLEFILNKGKSLVLMAGILQFASCSDGSVVPKNKEELEFIQQNPALIDSLKKTTEILKIQTDKLN